MSNAQALLDLVRRIKEEESADVHAQIHDIMTKNFLDKAPEAKDSFEYEGEAFLLMPDGSFFGFQTAKVWPDQPFHSTLMKHYQSIKP